MPTPFTHLWIAQRLLEDPALADDVRDLLRAELPAYLLGSVAADARPAPDSPREDTHFYRYDRPMEIPPWRTMLEQNSALCCPSSAAQRAFVAGYVAHLAVDEYWSRYMLHPHFAQSHWGGGLRQRFFVLHLLLIHMDERDLIRLYDWHEPALRRCEPQAWLAFMSDEVLCEWRDLIADQLIGESLTLQIFGERIQHSPAELRALLDDEAWMQSHLWENVTPACLDEVEEGFYRYSLEQMTQYCMESAYSQP